MIGSPPGFFITRLQFLPLKQEIRTHSLSESSSDFSSMVEHRGLEPLTPTLPVLCAPSCANAPGNHLAMMQDEMNGAGGEI